MADGKVVYEVRADDSKLGSDLDTAQNKVNSKQKDFEEKAKKVGLAIGTAFVAAGAAAVNFGMQYETSLAKASTLIDTNVTDMDMLSGKMLNLSDSSGIAADTLNEALYSALSAGIPATEDMGDAMAFLEKNTKLAKAGFTDVDSAVNTTAQVLNSYGMAVSETDRVQKILIQTQNLGQTTVNELGNVLAQVTPIASTMGVSFEQVGASLSVMTASGTPAAQATTQLSTLFTELGQNGTEASKNLAKATEGTKYAGMSFQDLMKAGVPLNDVIDTMGTYAQSSGVSLLDMFSSVEAGKAALGVAGANSDKFTTALDAMSTETDVVGEAYDKVASTDAAKFAAVMNELKNVAISLYTDGIQPMVATLYEIGSWMAENSEAATVIAIGIGTLTAAIIAYNIAQNAATITTWLATTAGAAFGAVLAFITSPVTLIILAIGALIAIVYLLVTNWDAVSIYLSEAFTAFADGAMAVFGAVGDFFIGLWDGIVSGFNSAAEGIGSIFGGIANFVAGYIDGIISIFSNLIDFIVNVFTGNWAGAWDNIVGIFDTIISGIGGIFKAPLNFVVDGINSFIDGINKIQIPDWVPGVGGKGINIPKIPRLKVGMDYVPSDYFPAYLDEGEAVLTKSEANIWRGMSGNLKNLSQPINSTTQSLSFDGMGISKSDIKDAFKEAMKEIPAQDTVIQLGYEEVARAANKGNVILETRYGK